MIRPVRWIVLISAIAGILIGLAAPAVAQGDGGGQIQVLGVERADDGPVTVEIAIPASIGQLAPVAQNFALTVDGEVSGFTVRPLTTAVDAILVLDTSGSMRGPALEAAKLAATAFVGRLPEGARVGVVSFGETVTVHGEPGVDRDAALADIDGLVARGETALWDGLVAAADVAGGSGIGQPYVVVLADGDDTVSEATRIDAVRALSRHDIGLYAIAIESPDADGAALAETVDEVGGNFAATAGTDQLDSLYVEIADRLASRYQLSFEPGEGAGSAVISVAAGDAVATTRTAFPGGGADLPAIAAEPEADGSTAADAVTVVGSGPGLLGGSQMLMIGAAAVFAALLVLGLVMGSPSVDVRIDSAAGADRVAGFNQRLAAAADSVVASRDHDGELDKALDAAGLQMRQGEFVLLSLMFVVGSSMVASVVAGWIGGVAAAIVASIAVVVYLSARASRRRAKFADQLTDTLGIMTGSLRAGRGLPQALELVSTEAPAPTSDQFRRIVFETRVGRDMTASMLGVADRMRSQDFEWLARAVEINRELGGDLTEVLDNVASTIRDRRKVARMVRSLSAEGRASGWVLLALPVVMFLFMLWRTPENVTLLLTEPLGRLLFLGGLAGMTVGYVWIRRLVDLKY